MKEQKFIVTKLKANKDILFDLAKVDCSLDMEALMSEILAIEEKVITTVLTDLLKRTPTIEDFKRCKKLYYNSTEKYTLTVDDIVIGVISKDEPYNNFGLTFTPDEKYS